MLTRETKIFIIFLLSFSVLLMGTTWFGDFDYKVINIPGFELDSNPFEEKILNLEFPQKWNSPGKYSKNVSYDFQITNEANYRKDVKLKFEVTSVDEEVLIRVILNDEEAEEFYVGSEQEALTRLFELDSGKNNLSLKFENCSIACPHVAKDSLGLLTRKDIEEKSIFFAKNWKDKDKVKRGTFPTEIHIYNFEKKNITSFVNFKIVSEMSANEKISVQFNGEEKTRLGIGSKYELYQSPTINLRPGENILKIDTVGNKSNTFSIRDFELVKEPNMNFRLGENWYPKENWYHDNYREFFNFHWMKENSTMILYNTKEKEINRDLELSLSTYYRTRNLTIFKNDKKIHEEKIESRVDEGRERVLLRNVTFKPGNNRIYLKSTSGCNLPHLIENKSDNRCLSFALYGYNIKEVGESEDYANQESNSINSDLRYYLILILFFPSLVSFFIFFVRKNLLKNIDVKILLSVLFIVALAFALRINNNLTYQLYLDEPWNVEVANNIYSEGKIELCSYEGETEVCNPFYKPAGFPFYISLLFFVFGFSLKLVFLNSVVLGSLSCALVFILVYILSNNYKLSLLSSLIFTIIPQHVFWSTTADSYVTSLFFILLSTIIFLIYLRDKGWESLYTFIFLFLFTITLRPENFILLGLFSLFYIIDLENINDIFKRKIILPLVIFLSFFLVYGRILLYSIQSYLDILKISVWEVSNYLNFSLELPIFVIILTFGIYLFQGKEKKISKFIALWTLFFVPLLFFHTGTDRFLIPLLLVLSISISKIIIFLLDNFDREIWKILGYNIILIVIFFSSLIITPTYNNMDERLLNRKVITEARNEIPDDCWIITEHPSMLTGFDNRILKTSYALENKEEIKDFSKEECVLFYEGIGCELDFERGGWNRHCEEFKDSCELESNTTYEGDELEYTFYNVKGLKQ